MSRQRGLSNGVQFALIFPGVLALFFLGLQWSMHAWASSIALASAQDGARAAAAFDGSEAAGLDAAAQAIKGDVLQDPQVQVERNPTTTTVTVTGTALSFFGLDIFGVEKMVSVPTERLT